MEISDADIKCLENDLLDIEDWIRKAIEGKINNCKKRMIQEWQPKIFADPDVEFMPATVEEFIQGVVKRADYKNRKQRDKEKEAKEAKIK